MPLRPGQCLLNSVRPVLPALHGRALTHPLECTPSSLAPGKYYGRFVFLTFQTNLFNVMYFFVAYLYSTGDLGPWAAVPILELFPMSVQ